MVDRWVKPRGADAFTQPGYSGSKGGRSTRDFEVCSGVQTARPSPSAPTDRVGVGGQGTRGGIGSVASFPAQDGRMNLYVQPGLQGGHRGVGKALGFVVREGGRVQLRAVGPSGDWRQVGSACGSLLVPPVELFHWLGQDPRCTLSVFVPVGAFLHERAPRWAPWR